MPVQVGDLNFVTLHGKYEDYAGNPVSGSVVFTPATTLYDVGSDLILVPKSFSVTLAADGSFSIDLPATDDPDVTPTGWTYTVTENFASGNRAPYAIQVPYNSPGGRVSLASLAPVPPAVGDNQFVLLTDYNAKINDLGRTAFVMTLLLGS